MPTGAFGAAARSLMTLVRIAHLGRPHGLRGEMILNGASLNQAELLAVREFTWRARDGKTRALTLESVRPATPRVLARFRGIEDRAAAAALTNGELLAERNQLPNAGPGVAYAFELIGLEVRREDGRPLGVLEDIVNTGAHPIYVVKGEREWLLPATAEVVRNVDLTSRIITIAMPRGLDEI